RRKAMLPAPRRPLPPGQTPSALPRKYRDVFPLRAVTFVPLRGGHSRRLAGSFRVMSLRDPRLPLRGPRAASLALDNLSKVASGLAPCLPQKSLGHTSAYFRNRALSRRGAPGAEEHVIRISQSMKPGEARLDLVARVKARRETRGFQSSIEVVPVKPYVPFLAEDPFAVLRVGDGRVLEGRLVQSHGNADHRPGAGFQDPAELAERSSVIDDVFEDVDTDQSVERCVVEGERPDVGEGRDAGHPLDIDSDIVDVVQPGQETGDFRPGTDVKQPEAAAG